MATLLGSGRAADKRVTNHDGWEFNGLLTLHTLSSTGTNYTANHLVGWSGGEDSFVPRIFFDTCMDHNQVRQDGIVREILLSDPAIVKSSHDD